MMKRKTTKVFLIEEFYKQQEIDGRLTWNSDKVHQLCRATHMEVGELRVMLRLTVAGFASRIMHGKNIDKQLSLLLMQIAVSKGYHSPASFK